MGATWAGNDDDMGRWKVVAAGGLAAGVGLTITAAAVGVSRLERLAAECEEDHIGVAAEPPSAAA